MRVSAVIPARLGSERLVRKPLAQIAGRPLIWHVWDRVRQSQRITNICVATDAEEIRSVVQSWGGTVLMTSPTCESGSERVASVLEAIEGDLVLNVQGDEPLIDPSMLDALVDTWLAAPCDIITPAYRITDVETLRDPNVVKVVKGDDGRALYFSRSPIPHVRDVPMERWLEHQAFWGHVGVYGFRREVLASYRRLPESALEAAEKLEQLRFVAAGLTSRWSRPATARWPWTHPPTSRGCDT